MIILRAIFLFTFALQVSAASTSGSRLTRGSFHSSDSDDDWGSLSHQWHQDSSDDDFDEVLSRLSREVDDACNLHMPQECYPRSRRRPTSSQNASLEGLDPSQSGAGHTTTTDAESPAHSERPLDRSPRLAFEACKMHVKYMCLFAYDACYNLPVALHHAQALRQLAYDAAVVDWYRNGCCEGIKTFMIGCAASTVMTVKAMWQSCAEASMAGLCGLASGCNACVVPLGWCKRACEERARSRAGQSSHGHRDEQPLLPPWKMSPQDEEKLKGMYRKIETIRRNARQNFQKNMDVRKNFENQVRDCFEYFGPPA